MGRFDGKTVLITGGGSGLGQAAARCLAEEGARLVLVDISKAGISETSEVIYASKPDAQILEIEADVAEEAQVAAYVRRALNRFGSIDGFFNNAGVEDRRGDTEDLSSDEFERVLSVNVHGVFYGLKYVLKVMREQGCGRIVNTSSVLGIRSTSHKASYTASKHAVIGLTRNVAIEYGRFGIGINAIAPGAILTPMVRNSLTQVSPGDWEAAGREFVAHNPMQRMGLPEEVGQVVAFLLSSEASFINGAVIPIDGGQSAQY